MINLDEFEDVMDSDGEFSVEEARAIIAELRAARECTAMLPIAMEHIARLEAGNAGKRPLALIGWRQAVQATKGDG